VQWTRTEDPSVVGKTKKGYFAKGYLVSFFLFVLFVFDGTVTCSHL
jgi:hypothetical protein